MFARGRAGLQPIEAFRGDASLVGLRGRLRPESVHLITASIKFALQRWRKLTRLGSKLSCEAEISCLGSRRVVEEGAKPTG